MLTGGNTTIRFQLDVARTRRAGRAALTGKLDRPIIAALKGVATENPDPKGVRQNMEEARASPSLHTVNESRRDRAVWPNRMNLTAVSLLFEENSLFRQNNSLLTFQNSLFR